ncbi:MAG TPA: winged helix DNA-binding domain-containing protein [Candidatus Dormibacteraeota bacterium]
MSAILAERLTRQLLAGPPAKNAAAVCERLLSVQAQDPMGARLALRARTQGLTVGDVEKALNDRQLVVTWLNRGTLHLVRSEDYFWLHPLLAGQPGLTSNTTRLAQLGVPAESAERDVGVIGRALADEGPLTRAELTARVENKQAFLHLINRASRLGQVVRGPMRGKQHCYVLVRDWLGEPPAFDRDRALAELGRRYLAAHAPADDRDLAKWAGVSLTDARRALRDAGAPKRVVAATAPPRLLGQFEEMLLGWASRELFAPVDVHRIVLGGMFLPLMLVGGRAAGTWRMPGRELVLEPFVDLTPDEAAALAADFADIKRFLQT